MKNSLRLKINLAILMSCLILAAIFSIISIPVQTRIREQRIEEIRVLMTAVYQQKREEIANEIFARQKEALADSLFKLQKVHGIVSITVFDLRGNRYVSTGELDAAPLSEAERRSLDRAADFSRVFYHFKPFAVYATAVQVIGEKVGYLKMYYDLQEIISESRTVIAVFGGLLGLILLIVFCVLNLMLTRSVILPVTQLREAINRLKNGDLGAEVPPFANDEIGEVGNAFNHMSGQLKQQHSELVASMEARDLIFRQLEESNAALEKLNRDLEIRVEARTAELMESNEKLKAEILQRQKADQEKKELAAQLNRSQKMEALGLLAGGVAHDLNNVLSGMVSYPDMLLMEMEEAHPLRRPIRLIRESGRKASAIVQDLLILSGRGVVTSGVVHLNTDVVSACLDSPELRKIRADHQGITLETGLDEGLMPIRGSVPHLIKTLLNLIVNAAESQPEGGEIVIRTENRYIDRPFRGYENVAEGDYAVLTVTDRGEGIATDDLNRIFEPFYTKKMLGRTGTGLGMAVVWGTIQDHNGYLNILTEPKEGTTFELYFPVTREKSPPIPQILSAGDIYGNGEKVLVIDDISEQREIASQLLSRLNYRVSTVPSGEEALEFLKENPVDILVLDMIMEPGMDGLETYREIVKRYPGQRAVISSGYAENERVREARSLGAGAYVRKPYSLDRIGSAIKQELAKNSLHENNFKPLSVGDAQRR